MWFKKKAYEGRSALIPHLVKSNAEQEDQQENQLRVQRLQETNGTEVKDHNSFFPIQCNGITSPM